MIAAVLSESDVFPVGHFVFGRVMSINLPKGHFRTTAIRHQRQRVGDYVGKRDELPTFRPGAMARKVEFPFDPGIETPLGHHAAVLASFGQNDRSNPVVVRVLFDQFAETRVNCVHIHGANVSIWAIGLHFFGHCSTDTR